MQSRTHFHLLRVRESFEDVTRGPCSQSCYSICPKSYDFDGLSLAMKSLRVFTRFLLLISPVIANAEPAELPRLQMVGHFIARSHVHLLTARPLLLARCHIPQRNMLPRPDLTRLNSNILPRKSRFHPSISKADHQSTPRRAPLTTPKP